MKKSAQTCPDETKECFCSNKKGTTKCQTCRNKFCFCFSEFIFLSTAAFIPDIIIISTYKPEEWYKQSLFGNGVASLAAMLVSSVIHYCRIRLNSERVFGNTTCNKITAQVLLELIPTLVGFGLMMGIDFGIEKANCDPALDALIGSPALALGKAGTRAVLRWSLFKGISAPITNKPEDNPSLPIIQNAV